LIKVILVKLLGVARASARFFINIPLIKKCCGIYAIAHKPKVKTTSTKVKD